MSDREQLAMAIAMDLEFASDAVTLKGHWLGGGEFGMQLQEVAELADARVHRRCLLPLQDDSPAGMIRYRREGLESCIEHFGRLGWHVRVIPGTQLLDSSLTIDRRSAYVFKYLNDDPGPHIFSSDRVGGADQIDHYIRAFDAQWAASVDPSMLERLYDASPEGWGELTASRIAAVSVNTWDALLRDLRGHPELVYSIDPRKFEELVAELLTRSGLTAKITPATRDGGRDILAFNETPVGSHLYLVECKRYGPDRPVAVSLVRQLYGVVAHERATAGLLVTTSHFTTDALRFRESIRNQLNLKDYHQLAAWILECSGQSARSRNRGV